MSKIQKELCDAAEVDTKRGEDQQDFLLRLALAVNKLPDAEWGKLSKEAQNWVNDASDAANAKKELPGMPDAEKPAESSRRRVSGDDAPAAKAYEPKMKDLVAVVTQRGKNLVGTIVELDKEVIVLKLEDGTEEELSRDRIANIGLAEGTKGRKDAADEGPRDPKAGDTVTVTTKRGKVVTGEVMEIDDQGVVMKVNGEVEEFDKSRVESIKIEGGRKAESAGEGRRSAADADAKDKKKKDDEPEGDGKRTRASNAGVSVGTRIRELIIANMDASQDEISKLLKKENLEFRENTLQLNYADAHKLLDMLKKAKLLKA